MQKSTSSNLLEVSNLYDLFVRRAQQSHNKVAYRQYDAKTEVWKEWLWSDVKEKVILWQQALHNENLPPASRIAIMLPNGVNWIICDQAILGLGMVGVPIFSHDNPGNVDYILQDSSAQILITDRVRWDLISKKINPDNLKKVVLIDAENTTSPQTVSAKQWLSVKNKVSLPVLSSSAIATLVYTSGTTGAPKGVVLTHQNILSNVIAIIKSFPIPKDNSFLSFLPLSHIFERTAGYYMTMYIGAEVTFSRSVNQLGEDMQIHRPTGLLAVPRVYDGIYTKISASMSKSPKVVKSLFNLVSKTPESEQGVMYRFASILLNALAGQRVRNIFGGQLRYALSGGAALSPNVARLFIALKVPLYQGYGLTETSPVIAVNRQDDNVPSSIGKPIVGAEVKIGNNDELLTRSQYVMQEYWNLPQATKDAIDGEGWFHTGDQAKIDSAGRMYITGRIKEIIVMSNGEKVPPVDIENVIMDNPKFDQVMLYGENRSYLIALLVFNEEYANRYLDFSDQSDGVLKKECHKELLKEIASHMTNFPSYAKIRRLIASTEHWTVENGLLTPTLKLKRAKIAQHFANRIEKIYKSI